MNERQRRVRACEKREQLSDRLLHASSKSSRLLFCKKHNFDLCVGLRILRFCRGETYSALWRGDKLTLWVSTKPNQRARSQRYDICMLYLKSKLNFCCHLVWEYCRSTATSHSPPSQTRKINEPLTCNYSQDKVY